jgi:hypothetical protein
MNCMHCIAHNPLCLLVLYALGQGHIHHSSKGPGTGCLCMHHHKKWDRKYDSNTAGSHDWDCKWPDILEGRHDTFKSCLHKHRYVKYVLLSLVENASPGHNMWYMQQLSSCRRREYFIAKLNFSVIIVSSIYQIISEVNTEHSFQCYLFLQGEVILEGSRKNMYFYTLKCTTFNFINYTNFNTNLQHIFYSLNGNSY